MIFGDYTVPYNVALVGVAVLYIVSIPMAFVFIAEA